MKTRNLFLLIVAACGVGCSESAPTTPDPAGSEIEHLAIFVRDWPNEYVEIDFKRKDGAGTLLIFRPPQPGVPRVLLDSIGPSPEDPEEIVALLSNFNIWAMADSNAVGGACSTRSGGWVCNPTFNDYSLVIGMTRGGVTRAQRYTRLRESTSNFNARALGDFVFALSRKRAGSLQRQ